MSAFTKYSAAFYINYVIVEKVITHLVIYKPACLRNNYINYSLGIYFIITSNRITNHYYVTGPEQPDAWESASHLLAE